MNIIYIPGSWYNCNNFNYNRSVLCWLCAINNNKWSKLCFINNRCNNKRGYSCFTWAVLQLNNNNNTDEEKKETVFESNLWDRNDPVHIYAAIEALYPNQCNSLAVNIILRWPRDKLDGLFNKLKLVYEYIKCGYSFTSIKKIRQIIMNIRWSSIIRIFI